ncbi:DUF2968 domain-containing protein [Burkholderia vietnamiensis]|uniref:DUF2968 domain-containing protein n=1 Tax=Burkholderia vietnamiensis TaxID=60552 RepID=UPI00075BBEB2|nr:DUF2968 domain-containing protein [Burkholderia vietnamiensis]KVF40989.1 hypothetical protein WJ09_24545 [Burkholderia vietnamiensis]
MKLRSNRAEAWVEPEVNSNPADLEPLVQPPPEPPRPEPADASLALVAALQLSHMAIPRGPNRAVHAAEVAEIEQLRAQAALMLFRVFRTFAYSVDLLFYPAELRYYVTLSQDERPWRALRAAEFDAADAAFRHFEEQALRLAEVEVCRAQLNAQTEKLSRLLAMSQEHAERLQQDLDSHAQATIRVTTRQQQLRKEVAQLEAKRVAAQAQLSKVERQIQRMNATANERLPHLATKRNES